MRHFKAMKTLEEIRKEKRAKLQAAHRERNKYNVEYHERRRNYQRKYRREAKEREARFADFRNIINSTQTKAA